MLEADPSQRITAEDALKHPWIRVSFSFVAFTVIAEPSVSAVIWLHFSLF